MNKEESILHPWVSKALQHYISFIPLICSRNSKCRGSLLQRKWCCINQELQELHYDYAAKSLIDNIQNNDLWATLSYMEGSSIAQRLITYYPMFTWFLTLYSSLRLAPSIAIFLGNSLPNSLLILLKKLPMNPSLVYFIKDRETANFLYKRYSNLIEEPYPIEQWTRIGNMGHIYWAFATPSFMINDPDRLIYLAARNGYADIIDFFMKNLPYNPKKIGEDALGQAIYKGHYNAVATILNYPDIDPSLHNNDAIKTAVFEGEERIVELLLKDPRVDPSVDENDPLYDAIERGYENIVYMLIHDPRIDPSENNNETLIHAVESNNFNIVEILLHDRRVDPSARNYMALDLAIQNENYQIVELLQYNIHNPDKP